MIGRTAEEDLVATATMKVRPCGTDIAGYRINGEVGFVVERTQAEGVRCENHGATTLGTVGERVGWVGGRIRRHTNVAGVVARRTGNTILNSAIEVIAHEKEVALSI